MSTEKQPEWEKELLKMNGEQFHFLEGEFNRVLSFIRSFASSLLDEVKLEEKKCTCEYHCVCGFLDYDQAVSDLTKKIENLKQKYGL